MNEQEILYGLTAFIAGVVGADDESAGKDGSALRTFSRQERSRCIFIFYTVFSFNYLRLFSFPPCRLRWRRGEQGGINQNQEKFVLFCFVGVGKYGSRRRHERRPVRG